MDDLLRLLSLQDANTRVVLLGCALLGASAGAVGALSVLRRRALAGDALAHAALPGVCVAFLVVGDRSLPAFLIGALVFGLLGVGTMAALRALTRLKEDAAMAIVLGVFFGLGIVLSSMIQRTPGGNRAGLDGFLFGKAASMVRQDVWLMGGVCAVCLCVVYALRKEFRLLCFDRDFGAAQGWPVVRLDLLLMALVACVTVSGLPAVGVVLMAAMLVVPGVTARLWTDRFSVMLALSTLLGMIGGVVGAALSAVLPAPGGAMSGGYPTGPTIALTLGAMFVFSALAAPRRGVLSRWIERRRFHARVREQLAQEARG